jgi:aspartate 1-decarboxylase
MLREMLRAKVHRATVTDRNVEYVGSLTLDASLMEACDLLPYERIDVYDVHNGERFSTYLMAGEPNSGTCCVNGAAARLVEVGDKIIIAAYAALTDEEARQHRPRVLLVDGKNRPLREESPIR